MLEIANGEILYRYANPNVLPSGQSELPTAIFNDSELSCDWKALQPAPESSIHVIQGKNMVVGIHICDAIRNPKNPKSNGESVDAWKQNIVHNPLEEIQNDPYTPNQAHSLIQGKKKAAVVCAIRDNSTYSIF
jgi:hypothetical protein